MTAEEWARHPGHAVKATRAIVDISGRTVARGALGELADVDTIDNVLFVSFPEVGAVICDLDEVRPA